ncbi:MAG: alpha/beta hydrolase [Colwellia sp.]
MQSADDLEKINIEEISYNIGGLSLRGLACGEDKNEVVLCLHGWLDNAASFLPFMHAVSTEHNISTEKSVSQLSSELGSEFGSDLRSDLGSDLSSEQGSGFSSEKNCLPTSLKNKRIIAIDWFGHGLSSHRSCDAHYHFIDWVYDLLQLFELNNWQHIDIVAHSMGGMVASAFAAAFPEKVKSLTLIDSIGFLNVKAEQATKQLRDGMLSRLKSNSFGQATLNAKKKSVKKSLHSDEDSAIKARMNVSDLSFINAQFIVNRGLITQNNGYVWRSDSRLRITSPYRLTLKQAEQFVRDIKCPVQLIHGSMGMDIVTSGLKHFGPLIQDFTAFEFEGGHHVHMEQPQVLAQLIINFIDKKV